jgi:CRP-like cAMP-binding protein
MIRPAERVPFRNKLLNRLSLEELGLVEAKLQKTILKSNTRIRRPASGESHIYFPESCVLSLIAGGKKTVEVALLGNESMTEMPGGPGDKSPLSIVVTVEGEAWSMNAEEYADAKKSCQGLADLAARFHQWLLAQVALSAASHAGYSIPQRVARRLLMIHDRLGVPELPLVHRDLSAMLSVRRSGVTEALHILEGRGAIKTRRARIEIADRGALIESAAESYGAVEAEYERVFRP